MDDLFILCVDRDCNENRRDRLDQLEKEFPVFWRQRMGGGRDLGFGRTRVAERMAMDRSTS